MYMVFLGESGNTGNRGSDPGQPQQVYAGLVIHESRYVAVNGEFNALCRRHFGSPLGGEGAPAVLKIADLYQGRGFFNAWPQQRRAELIQDCLNILLRRESPVIVSYVDKARWQQARAEGNPAAAAWDTPAAAIVSKFLFALNMFLDEAVMADTDPEHIMDAPGPIRDYALVVAESGRSTKPEYMRQFLHSEVEIPTPAVLENFCYTPAGESVCTQLANMCAYFVRRWLQNPGGAHGYFTALRDGRVIQVIYPVQF